MNDETRWTAAQGILFLATGDETFAAANAGGGPVGVTVAWFQWLAQNEAPENSSSPTDAMERLHSAITAKNSPITLIEAQAGEGQEIVPIPANQRPGLCFNVGRRDYTLESDFRMWLRPLFLRRDVMALGLADDAAADPADSLESAFAVLHGDSGGAADAGAAPREWLRVSKGAVADWYAERFAEHKARGVLPTHDEDLAALAERFGGKATRGMLRAARAAYPELSKRGPRGARSKSR